MPEKAFHEQSEITDLTNDAIEIPDEDESIDITDQVNADMRSGIQRKPSVEVDLNANTTQSFEELQEGDEVMEILNIALENALESGDTETIITCQQKDDLECNALRSILEKDSRIKSFDEEHTFGGKFGFRIQLKTPAEVDLDAEEHLAA